MRTLDRRAFIGGLGLAAAFPAWAAGKGSDTTASAVDYPTLQRDCDEVTGSAFRDYLRNGGDLPALVRLDKAFDKVLAEMQSADVSAKPAVWLLYNMGVIVKTKKCCFSIDLMHRRACEMVPLLDFALITHNHGDHFTEPFYREMDLAGKTVISNFKDNYAAYFNKNVGGSGKPGVGGYTRERKTFVLGDVKITTKLTDHNPYLIDYTTAFDINAAGLKIFHSGDCSNVQKLAPVKGTHLWFVHPGCGIDLVAGHKKIAPKLTAIVHLCELGHDRWRMSWQDGLTARDKIVAAGGKAIVPVWGVRLV